jgi:hypothetical protein
MVQLLVNYGADVNIPARGATPLAKAEARGYAEVASILRKAGARSHTNDEERSREKPRGQTRPVSSPEEVMRKTGMSEEELTRRFMEHLIQQGKNPFNEMPEHFLRDAEKKFPDLIELARQKFGTSR